MLVLSPDTAFQTSEPIRRSHWKLEFVSTPAGQMPRDRDMEIRETPPFIYANTTLPSIGVNTTVNIPSVQEGFSGGFSFHLWTKPDLWDWWLKWRNLCYDPETDRVGLYNEVVGQAVVTLFGPAAKNEKPAAILKIGLVDVWPSSLSLDSLSQDSDGEAVGYSVELQISAVKSERV